MNGQRYILCDKQAVLEPDFMKWAAWYKHADRVVRNGTFGESQVSTVFLGIDHAFCGGVPMLFQTMVFGGPWDQEQARCSTWDEAVEMHEAMVKRVLAATQCPGVQLATEDEG